LSTKKKSSTKKDSPQPQKKISLKNYPRLVKSKNTKARQGVIDYDYLKKLSPAELEFLNQFTDEYYCASFSEDSLHPKEQKKDCETRNNIRNNDLLTIKEITGGINYNNYPTQLDELLEKTKDTASSREEVLEEIEDSILSLRILRKLT
jgi:hypothetical protein